MRTAGSYGERAPLDRVDLVRDTFQWTEDDCASAERDDVRLHQIDQGRADGGDAFEK
jgi:hypothetical protein